MPVERGGAVGVGRPQRHISDIAVLDRGDGAGHRPAEHPAVAERVDDRGVAGTVVFVDLPLHPRAALPRALQRGVGVRHVQHEAHRSRLWVWSFEAKLGILVGQVQHTAGDRQLGVPDTAVIHRDRLADHDGAERIDVPGDGVPRIRHAQVGDRCRPRCRFGDCACGGFVEFRDGGFGATHDNSFCSITLVRKEIHSRFQPRPKSGRERRIGLNRKLVAMQHGQRIDAVVHDIPPSGSGYCCLKARRARTSSASVACTVRPISSAHSGTEQSSM